MLLITEDVQLVIKHPAVQSAKPEQNAELENIVKEMKLVQSSIPQEQSSVMKFDSGGGAKTKTVNNSTGQQIINNVPLGNQYFGSVILKQKEEFSFRKIVGVCLGQAPHIDRTLFIGRRSEIEKMTEVLKPGDMSQEQQRLVLGGIGGIGGIGKTQLAISYAKHHRHDHESVLWFNAMSEATLKDCFRTVAEVVFDVHDPEILEGEHFLILSCRWLSDKKNTQWLLIFDNRDNSEQYIEASYPPVSHGAIVAIGPQIRGRLQPSLFVSSGISDN